MKKINVIILAAGKGKRMKSLTDKYSKVTYPIFKVPLVEYVLNSVKEINPDSIVTVIGFGGEATKAVVEKYSKIAVQKEQLGTGHAVLQAKEFINDSKDEITLILCGDAPLIRGETLKKLIDFHIRYNNDQTVLSAIVDNPFGYGRIVRDEYHNLVKVVEETDCTPEERKINEVNSGVVVFNNNCLIEGLNSLSNDNAKKEYYLTQLISMFLNNRRKVGVMIMRDPREMEGINDRFQLFLASKELQKRINKKHMLDGVSISDSNNVYIGPYVTIQPDTIIEPNTIILGHTKIGKEVYIGSGTHIEDSEIPDGTVIEPLSYIKNNKKIK